MTDSVEKWLSRLSPNYAKTNMKMFRPWIKWVRKSETRFRDYTPDELVEYQRNTDNGSRYDILDEIVQPYIIAKSGRHSYLQRIYATIRSFFMHNRAELPEDPNFNIQADKEKSVGLLTLEDLRKIVLASNPTYRAIWLCMFQGGMGQNEIVYWNEHGYDSLMDQLERDLEVVKVDLPGRKKARNVIPFYTLLGPDAIDAVRTALKYRPSDGKTIFLSKYGKSISKNALWLYWNYHMNKLGLVEKKPDKPGHRTGRNPHEVRDLFRSAWEKSPAKASISEFMMGHYNKIDPNEYNKAFRDEAWVRREYAKALPMLQIMSSDRPYGKVDIDEIERQNRRIKELEAENEELKRDLNQSTRKTENEIEALRKIVFEQGEFNQKLIERINKYVKIMEDAGLIKTN